jgi:hypothetical protein
MSKILKTQGKSCATKLIENQSGAHSGAVLAGASIAASTPRGGLRAADLLPLFPTPFMILGSPEGGQ